MSAKKEMTEATPMTNDAIPLRLWVRIAAGFSIVIVICLLPRGEWRLASFGYALFVGPLLLSRCDS